MFCLFAWKWCKMTQHYRNIAAPLIEKTSAVVLAVCINFGKVKTERYKTCLLLHSLRDHFSPTCLLSVHSTSLVPEIEAPDGIWQDARPRLNESPSLTDKWYIKLSVSEEEVSQACQLPATAETLLVNLPLAGLNKIWNVKSHAHCSFSLPCAS